MNEPEVVKRVHQFLQDDGLEGNRLAQLYTDAHHTLLGFKSLRPFQRFTLDLGDRVVYPDLVGQLDDGETLLAVEAKGSRNLTKGLAQAQQYQEGFHLSVLAADASAIGGSIDRLARRQQVGLLGVKENVEVIYWPRARQPWRDPARSIRRQMDAASQVADHNTFLFNVPTHYLAWTVALTPGRWYDREELPAEIDAYPMPKDWMGAVRGASKLSLIKTDGGRVRLTTIGGAVRDVLDTTIEAWADVHRKARRTPLVDHKPRAAAVLRLLVMQDSMARLIVRGLKRCPDHRATFDELARVCSKLDYDRSSVIFFVPERFEGITDTQGRIRWSHVEDEHFRSTTSYQFKSILKHAGIIKDTGLGGSKPPQEDEWVLRE